MGRLFEKIRERVTARQAAEAFGLPVNRQGKALCPWHPDKRPSLSFDPKTGRCHCFACGQGGDAVDLAAKLLNVTPLAAAQIINNNFGLWLEEAHNRPPTEEELAHATILRRNREQEQAERRERAWHFTEDCRRIHQIEATLEHFTPANSEENLVYEKLLRELGIRQTRVERYLAERG